MCPLLVNWWRGLRALMMVMPENNSNDKNLNLFITKTCARKRIFQNSMSFSFFIKLFMYYKKEKKALIISVGIILSFLQEIKGVCIWYYEILTTLRRMYKNKIFLSIPNSIDTKSWIILFYAYLAKPKGTNKHPCIVAH